MSWKSRRGLRLAVQWLPWERLGRRMVYIVLTYPGEWGRYVPDGQALRRHRRDFFERWYRRWGERVTGLWAVEFQVSGRPHLNIYCKVPDIVPDAEYEELVEFTRHVAGLELANGKYEGRRRAGFPSRLEGDFVHWGLEAWSECVGSTVRAGGAHVRRDKWHHHKGFEPRVFNYRRDETELDRRRVGEYLAREAGKAIQKRAPEGFGPVTAWWRYCGPGFRPEYLSEELPFAVGAELSRRMERWVRLRMRALGLNAGDRDKRLFGAGVAAFDMTPDQLVRLERWAWRAGVRKAAAGRLTKRGLLDRETGELLWQPAGRIWGATGSLGVGVS